MEKIIQKLEKMAESLEYGEVDVKFSISRGEIKKAVITEKKEVVLLSCHKK